jgi:hypothetical protein
MYFLSSLLMLVCLPGALRGGPALVDDDSVLVCDFLQKESDKVRILYDLGEKLKFEVTLEKVLTKEESEQLSPYAVGVFFSHYV